MHKFTLSEYAIFSAVFLQLQNLNAQVQYIDIEPDVVLDDIGELFLLDFDQDGIEDFRFVHNKGVFFTDWFYEPRYFDAIFAGALGDRNWIAGSYYTVGSAAYSSYITFRPYMIPFGYPIGVLLSFQDDYSQLVAAAISTPLGDIIDYDANWLAGAEAFFGIRIERDDHYYYGWLRVTISDSAKSLNIHDYAHELIADKSLFTGDSIGTLSVTTTTQQSFDINCDGVTLFLYPGTFANSEKAMLNIYDLSGKLVFSQPLFGQEHAIPLLLQTGIYMATYSSSDKMISKMIAVI